MENVGEMLQKMIKSALKHNSNLDLAKVLGSEERFYYFPLESFQGKEKVLLMGCSGIKFVKDIVLTVGKAGKVIIVTENQDEKVRVEEDLEAVQKEIGFCNSELVLVSSYDLRVNPEYIVKELSMFPVRTFNDYINLQKKIENQKEAEPFLNNESVDIVYIDLLNRYTKEYVNLLLSEAFRILKRKGILLIKVYLSDEPLKSADLNMRNNIKMHYIPLENEIEEVLILHGYIGMRYKWRAEIPQFIHNTIEIRPFLIEAYKGEQGPCLEKGHAVFYIGPWKEVVDDDGHKLYRGQRMAVCEKTYKNLTSCIYKGQIIGIPPYNEVSDGDVRLFDCDISEKRDPKVTKGLKPLFEEKNITKEDINESSCC